MLLVQVAVPMPGMLCAVLCCAAGMQPPFGFNDGGPMAKRMRHIDGLMQQGPMQGGMGAGQMQQQQDNQQQQQQQQQQRGPGWAGTVAANDYCQNFVDTGLRPQNYLGGGAHCT
jgi:hypothetical protein